MYTIPYILTDSLHFLTEFRSQPPKGMKVPGRPLPYLYFSGTCQKNREGGVRLCLDLSRLVPRLVFSSCRRQRAPGDAAVFIRESSALSHVLRLKMHVQGLFCWRVETIRPSPAPSDVTRCSRTSIMKAVSWIHKQTLGIFVLSPSYFTISVCFSLSNTLIHAEHELASTILIALDL